MMLDAAKNPLTFQDLGLKPELTQALVKAGFHSPTDIQVQAIPAILAGSDLLAQAQTGSGKTAAFILPALHKLTKSLETECLVLVPTRELAQQVVGEALRFAPQLQGRIISVVGGQSIRQQMESVNRGAKIVVATPGRLLDHLGEQRFRSFAPSLVVLDEADEMLDMGFFEDVKKILASLPKDRQTLLFSATMPGPIETLAAQWLDNPVHVKLVRQGDLANQKIEQILHVIRSYERPQALVRVLEAEDPEKAIVFCATKRETDELNSFLQNLGFKSQALHGDIPQTERNRVIADFKKGVSSILIATDVASRGLDIDGLTHVFNYQLPECTKRFIHRVGRTGRCGRTGKAITLVTDKEWQSHVFFRYYPRKKFTISEIPTKTALQQLVEERLIAQVKKADVCASTRERLHNLPQEEAFELLCQLYSYLSSQKKVSGDEHIGTSPQMALKQLKAVGPSHERRSPASRHHRPQTSGRSHSGRPQGGRSQGESKRFSSAPKRKRFG